MTETVYYNDNNKDCIKHLRALIQDGLINKGELDERSIKDIQANKLIGYTRVHLFAGMGGWEEALRIAGWPEGVSVWTGSPPCQPFSKAGKRKGFKDERHLWPEMRRLIDGCRPNWVFGEQVSSKDGRLWLSGVRSEMEKMGYGFWAVDTCSAGVGAPNIRQRLYWVAFSGQQQQRGRLFGSGEGIEKNPIRISDKPERSGLCCWLADTGCKSDEQWGKLGDLAKEGEDTEGETQEREWCGNADSDCCTVGGMGDPKGDNKRRMPESAMHGEGGEIGRSGGVSRMAKAGSAQSRRIPDYEREEISKTEDTDSLGFWSDYRIIECKDGKSRRIPTQCEFQPLAPRLPGRVALLKMIGNAINPIVAAEFIGTVMDVFGIPSNKDIKHE